MGEQPPCTLNSILGEPCEARVHVVGRWLGRNATIMWKHSETTAWFVARTCARTTTRASTSLASVVTCEAVSALASAAMAQNSPLAPSAAQPVLLAVATKKSTCLKATDGV